MKSDDTARQFATWLLRLAHRFSPPHAQEWGDAMLAELGFVEGPWAALAWAEGGTRVLMIQTLLSFFKGRGGEAASVPSGPFRSEVPMRRLTFGLAILGVGVLLVLLFAPSFKQALNVSKDSWLWAFDQPPLSARALNRLAEQARAERDAETLAFVALQLPPGPESVRMAEEAVELDPKLTWIYFSLASRGGLSPAAAKWAERLRAWDPPNAIPRLLEGQLEAERISNSNFLAASPRQLTGDARWMSAMAAAFAATKYDSYLSVRLDLDRAVMARRHLTNPLLILHGISWQPLPDIALLKRYAYMTYDRGKGFETKGDLEQASREYWTVARFGQVMHLQAQTNVERLAGAVLQREAYQKLESVAERSGREDERALLAYQIESLSPPRQILPDNGFWIGVYLWNAEIGQVSLLALLVSGILLAGWGLYLLAQQLGVGVGSDRLGGFFRASGFAGALGLLVSSLTLYLSYHPYAELFGRFAKGRGVADANSLMTFWGFAEVPSALNGMFSSGFGWLVLLVLAVCLLGFEIFRMLASRRTASAAV